MNKATLALLLQAWCQRNKKKECDLFLDAANYVGKKSWDAERWQSHWDKHNVMHPTPKAYLLLEMNDDPRAKEATQAS